jgi:hypothetical protein
MAAAAAKGDGRGDGGMIEAKVVVAGVARTEMVVTASVVVEKVVVMVEVAVAEATTSCCDQRILVFFDCSKMLFLPPSWHFLCTVKQR